MPSNCAAMLTAAQRRPRHEPRHVQRFVQAQRQGQGQRALKPWGSRLREYWGLPLSAWRSTQPVPEDQGQLGAAARQLLDDPVLHEALDRVQTKLIDAWRNTAPGETMARDEAYRMYWSLEQFKSELRVMIANAGLKPRATSQ